MDGSSRSQSGRSFVLRSENVGGLKWTGAVTAQEPWAPLQVAAVFLRWQTDAKSSLMSCQMRVLQRTVQTRIGSAFVSFLFCFLYLEEALLALGLDKSVLTSPLLSPVVEPSSQDALTTDVTETILVKLGKVFEGEMSAQKQAVLEMHLMMKSISCFDLQRTICPLWLFRFLKSN